MGWTPGRIGLADALLRPASNQLWRNVLLGIGVHDRFQFDDGFVLVVALAHDPHVGVAMRVWAAITPTQSTLYAPPLRRRWYKRRHWNRPFGLGPQRFRRDISSVRPCGWLSPWRLDEDVALRPLRR